MAFNVFDLFSGDTDMSGVPFLEDIPLLGKWFRKDMSKEQQKNLREIAEKYESERVPNQRRRMQALQQAMSLFEPLNTMMAQQYGPQYVTDYSKLFENPYESKQVPYGTGTGSIATSTPTTTPTATPINNPNVRKK